MFFRCLIVSLLGCFVSVVAYVLFFCSFVFSHCLSVLCVVDQLLLSGVGCSVGCFVFCLLKCDWFV